MLAAGMLLATPLCAATLQVGPDAAFATPSAAAAKAQEGDTIAIAPGEYFDCAAWRADRLTITGPTDPATPAVLSDAACHGKALFVVMGQDITIRHLTFTRVRVVDGNGAGIRAEGRNLTVENSRFVNNQVAILAADMPDGTLSITDSHFEGNGACTDGPPSDRRCLASVLTGRLRSLRIERSVFTASRGGELLRAAAQRTDLLANRFADGTDGHAGALVVLAGGAMLVAGNVFEKGPASAPSDRAAVVRDLWGPAATMVWRGNTLQNNTGRELALLHNLSAGTPRLEGNRTGAGDAVLDESGYWTARARDVARGARDDIRAVAGKVKRVILRLLPL